MSKKEATPGTDPERDPERDPVVPEDPPPRDLPGTEGGVLAEVTGTTQFQGYANIDRIRKANQLKNAGVQAALPPWTIPGVVFRLLHFGVGTIRALQGREAESVRKALSWPRSRELPQWGTIESNARTVMNAVVECTQGDAVDIDGAVRANRLRNSGLVYAFPSALFPGVRLRLRHLGHPWLAVVRSDAEDRLKAALGVRRSADLPAEAEAEVDRIMVLASIIGAESGTVRHGGKDVDLTKMETLELRSWFENNLMPPADLRGKVPSKRDERERYFQLMYAKHNPDVLSAFLEAHTRLRTAENDEILARGEDFCVGADWDYEPGSAKYEPEAESVDLTKMDRKELRDLLRDNFFPRADLKARPPKDAESREAHFVKMYANFNNQLLNELLELEAEIRDLDHDLLLGKETDFIVGLADDTDYSG